MTETEFLLFAGIPASIAIILLMADYRWSGRRLQIAISKPPVDEESERGSAKDPRDISSPFTARHVDPLAELERL